MPHPGPSSERPLPSIPLAGRTLEGQAVRRGPRLVNAGQLALLAAAALFLYIPSAEAQTVFVRSGDNGAIEFPLENDPAPLSQGAVTQAQVRAEVASGDANLISFTQEAAVNIEEGNTTNLKISYQIDGAAPDGTQFQLDIIPEAANAASIEPPLTSAAQTLTLQVENTLPLVKVFRPSGQGPQIDITTKAVTNSNQVNVEANAGEGGAGIVQFVLTKLTGGVEISTINVTTAPFAQVTFPEGGGMLAEGRYRIDVTDEGGKTATTLFAVDRTTPTVAFPNGPWTKTSRLEVVFGDPESGGAAGSGIDFALLFLNGVLIDAIGYNGQSTLTTEVPASIPELVDERYDLFIFDRAGNETRADVWFDKAPPEVTVTVEGGSPTGPATNSPFVVVISSDLDSGSKTASATIEKTLGPGFFTINRVVVTSNTTELIRFPDPQFDAQESLTRGVYQMTVKDKAGNETVTTFSHETSSPTVVFDRTTFVTVENTPSPEAPTEFLHQYEVDAEAQFFGLGLAVFQDHNGAAIFNQQTYAPNQTNAATLASVQFESREYTAIDHAGNVGRSVSLPAFVPLTASTSAIGQPNLSETIPLPDEEVMLSALATELRIGPHRVVESWSATGRPALTAEGQDEIDQGIADLAAQGFSSFTFNAATITVGTADFEIEAGSILIQRGSSIHYNFLHQVASGLDEMETVGAAGGTFEAAEASFDLQIDIPGASVVVGTAKTPDGSMQQNLVLNTTALFTTFGGAFLTVSRPVNIINENTPLGFSAPATTGGSPVLVAGVNPVFGTVSAPGTVVVTPVSPTFPECVSTIRPGGIGWQLVADVQTQGVTLNLPLANILQTDPIVQDLRMFRFDQDTRELTVLAGGVYDAANTRFTAQESDQLDATYFIGTPRRFEACGPGVIGGNCRFSVSSTEMGIGVVKNDACNASNLPSGSTQVSSCYELPTITQFKFGEKARVQFCVRAEELAGKGVELANLRIGKAPSGTTVFTELGNLTIDSGSLCVKAETDSASTFIVFGEQTLPPTEPDVTPPVTTLELAGSSFTAAGGAVYIATPTTVAFSAVDPVTELAPTSGVEDIFYTLNQVFTDTGAATAFVSPFTLGVTSATFAYAALDNAGNLEALQHRTIFVDGEAPAARLRNAGTGAQISSGAQVSVSVSFEIALNDPEIVTPGPAAPGSGGARRFFVIDGDIAACGFDLDDPPIDPQASPGTCANPEFTSAFNLALGTHTVSMYGFDNVGNRAEPVSVAFEVVAAQDEVPPTTTLNVLGDSISDSSGNVTAALSAFIDLQATDGGDPTSGVDATFYAADPAPALIDTGLSDATSSQFTLFSGPFALSEGSHTVAYASRDQAGNYEQLNVRRIDFDGTPPVVTFSVDGTSATGPGGLVVDTSAQIVLTAEDPVVSGATSGIDGILMLINIDPETCGEEPDEFTGPPGTCDNPEYAGPFSLADGTYTVYYQGFDGVDNEGEIESVSFTVAPILGGPGPGLSVDPATGPVGIPFTINGTGFGSFAGANTRVEFGGTAAQITVWNDTTIKGKIPGLSTGTYAVEIIRPSEPNESAGNFEVILLDASGLSPSQGPIGITFTINGPGFGPYAGANTRVLIGGTAAQITVWNDNTIKGKVPGISTGSYSLVIEREISGFIAQSHPVPFTVSALAPTDLTPASAPIGQTFTLSGPGFGAYAGANTQVLVGSIPAKITVWNDATIKGQVPGVGPGAFPLTVVRKVGAFEQLSEPEPFTVTLPTIADVTPSSAPIGQVVTLTGTSFGSYAGANTRVFFDGTQAVVTVWNDTTIKVKVPGMEQPGLKDLIVERQSFDGGIARSAAVPFQVEGLAPEPIEPSSGPIGIPFTINGMDFGSYAGANTRVLFGSTPAVITVWNDMQIKGRVPALAEGEYGVTVERQDGGDISSAFVSSFTLTPLVAAQISPPAAPVGAPFTIDGAGFGPYAGANTRVLIAGEEAVITVWNNEQIKGRVPGVAAGTTTLIIEREEAGSVQASAPAAFTVAAPTIAQLTPSSGPVGITLTLDGSGFGPFAGANTQLKIGGNAAIVTVWNDNQIKGRIPGLAPGDFPVTVERTEGAFTQISASASFTLTNLDIAAVEPSSGPIGITITLSGGPFGAYAGANTQFKIGGQAATVTVWNDATIKAKVPALAPGAYDLVVERVEGGFTQTSASRTFTVTDLAIAAIEPSSGPIGITLTLSGGPFGPYAGANTQLKIGGQAATVTVWNDTTIKAKVPALAPGAYDLVVERVEGGFTQTSASATFTVTDLTIASITPSSAPIGAPITLTGGPFGAYAGANTRLLLGGTAATVTVWNDTTIKARVPDLPSGTQPLWLERISGQGVQASATSFFEVLTPTVNELTPSSAPIGAPFELLGFGFGPYAGANTRVLIGGEAATITVWNDSRIKGKVPGALAPGSYTLVVERQEGAGLVQSTTQAFEVLKPVVSTMTPTVGGEGTVVTLDGHGFGPFAGSQTRLLVAGDPVTVSVWNDRRIRWTVPASLPDGMHTVVVERAPPGGGVQSDPVFFTKQYNAGMAAYMNEAPLSEQPDMYFEAALSVPADEGGTVESPVKAAVEVPAEAIEEDTEITLKRAGKADIAREQAMQETGVKPAGEPIEFGPEGTQFAEPVTISLPYDEGLGRENLKVHYWNPASKAWEALASVVDTQNRVVRAQTTHFSLYQVLGTGSEPAAGTGFNLGDVYVFPNPAVRGAKPTFHIEVGTADEVRLRIYDLSGRRVDEITINGPPAVIGGQPAYEIVWDRHIPSGVYFYAVQATRSGFSKIRKRGKFAVVR